MYVHIFRCMQWTLNVAEPMGMISPVSNSSDVTGLAFLLAMLQICFHLQQDDLQ